jgi:tRNA A37 threonylcarbamoyladenosine dehydratase
LCWVRPFGREISFQGGCGERAAGHPAFPSLLKHPGVRNSPDWRGNGHLRATGSRRVLAKRSEDASTDLHMHRYGIRFGGIRRLYSSEGLDRLRAAHVCVIGIGGVGSWAVEALARSGVGTLTLVDMDDICVSNVNRQIHATESEIHQPKVDVMAARVRSINPDCVVNTRRSFFTRSNAAEILGTRFDYVLDAIDSVREKALCVSLCRMLQIPVFTSGGAGGRRDPTRVRVDDLSRATHDRLLQSVRKQLRSEHGFARGGRAFGVECVFSPEAPVFPKPGGGVCETRGVDTDPLKLDCRSGFGSATFVTGTFGFVAAARIVAQLAAGHEATAAGLPGPSRPATSGGGPGG